jgi:hypothetical protein
LVVTDPGWLTLFWTIWLILLAGGFVAAETVALVSRGRGGTLTEFTKRQLGVSPPRPRRKWTVATFTAALVVLTVFLVPHMTYWPWRWFWE